MKKIIVFLLFIGFSVSVIHPYLMDDYEHESVKSFVAEFDAQSHYGDLCDFHFAFHIPFTLDKPEISIPANDYKEPELFGLKHLHTVETSFFLIKPPIA